MPDFSLRRENGEQFTQDDLDGRTTVLVFYPNAFSPVCTDQFQIYDEVREELAERGAVMYGVSCDQSWSQAGLPRVAGRADRAAVGLRAQGRRVARLRRLLRARPASPTARSSSSGPTGVVRWSHLGDTPGDLPGVNLIFDGLAASAA